jgi:acetyl esterase/lipase
MVIDKTKNDWLPRQLAERGFAAFSIEYRPSTTAPFPAALEDVQAAVRFVRAHAARYHVDPRRLAAAGGSSGGHLAALLATWGEGSTDVGARVRLALSWSGPMDLEPLLRSPNRELVSIVQTFLGCSASSPACADKARLASPITHVDPSDGAFYLTNSVDEIIPASQARQMASALAQADLPHEVTFLTSGHHGLNAAASYKGFDPAFAFLTQWIEPGVETGGTPSPSPGTPSASKPVSEVPATGNNEKATQRRGSLSTERDLLPLLSIAALVVAIAVLVVAIVLMRRVSRAVARERQPSDDAASAAANPTPLVSSRMDDLQ